MPLYIIKIFLLIIFKVKVDCCPLSVTKLQQKDFLVVFVGIVGMGSTVRTTMTYSQAWQISLVTTTYEFTNSHSVEYVVIILLK